MYLTLLSFNVTFPWLLTNAEEEEGGGGSHNDSVREQSYELEFDIKNYIMRWEGVVWVLHNEVGGCGLSIT